MPEREETIESDGVHHPKWAFDQGRSAGLQNKTTERGLMTFGLSCAATPTDERNTRGWLAGFDAGQREREAHTASSAPAHDWDTPLPAAL